MQRLIRALRFRTTNNANTEDRDLLFTLTDGDGGSATATKKIDVG